MITIPRSVGMEDDLGVVWPTLIPRSEPIFRTPSPAENDRFAELQQDKAIGWIADLFRARC